uniref:non-specific serine/threonine protein kinase n=1 Tax=Guillardia theta TaxID=55529 RepID=A0A7S4N047_GUITH|mmetsp:Transcript_14054/g.48437  ORF Transcript_14054/g.48437 Transcript_14054/m.48437 type:complete len:680 (+) Transcript_14054:261-2300(+)
MQRPQSTRDDFDFLRKVGRGASSVVFKARRKADNRVYCVKEIDMSAVVPEEEEQALLEVQLLASFEHPYVIRYYDSFLDDEILHIVMEWAEHGTLSDRIKSEEGKVMKEIQIWKWTLQITVGLNHMHEKKVLHRDLKSANVFITANGDAKIGDLGVSRMLNNTQEMAHTMVGTPYYLSPELCEGSPYNVKSDVWALGCVIFEMCTGGGLPFQASNQGALILRILSEQQEPLPSRFSPDLMDLVNRCLIKAPQRRPDTRDILARNDVVAKAKRFNITLPQSARSSEGQQDGPGGGGATVGATDFQLHISRLQSAPAASNAHDRGHAHAGCETKHEGGTNTDVLQISGEMPPVHYTSSPAMDAKHQSRAGEVDDVASDLKKMNVKSKNVNMKGNAKAGTRRRLEISNSLPQLNILTGRDADGGDLFEDCLDVEAREVDGRSQAARARGRGLPPGPARRISSLVREKQVLGTGSQVSSRESETGAWQDSYNPREAAMGKNRPVSRHSRRPVDFNTPIKKKNIASCTSPASFHFFNPERGGDDMFNVAAPSPCSRLVLEKFGSRDDSGIGLRSPEREAANSKGLYFDEVRRIPSDKSSEGEAAGDWKTKQDELDSFVNSTFQRANLTRPIEGKLLPAGTRADAQLEMSEIWRRRISSACCTWGQGETSASPPSATRTTTSRVR